MTKDDDIVVAECEEEAENFCFAVVKKTIAKYPKITPKLIRLLEPTLVVLLFLLDGTQGDRLTS